uniref:VP6 protein n=1 Tax=Okhotskiy virus TaxID=1471048 RepID=W8P1S7_9REOV|nr:VP6 protein [Okhotskiy virus]
MSTRLILLAPGDVITGVRAQLERRGIDVRVTIPEGEADQENGAATGTDTAAAPAGAAREPGTCTRSAPARGEVDTRTAGDPQRTSVEREAGSTDADVRNSTSRGDAPEGNSERGDRVRDARSGSSPRDSGGNRNPQESREGEARSDSVEFGGAEEGAGVPFVATARIRDALRERGYEDIQVLGSGTIRPTRDHVLLFGAAALKELGVGQDEGAAQKDAEARLRRDRVRATVNVERIHSVQRLNEEFPVKKRERQHVTPVVLVTNDPQFVSRAHILYTAPTGDTTWKETARKATQRRDIRAYAYEEHEKSPGEALLVLIDAL